MKKANSFHGVFLSSFSFSSEKHNARLRFAFFALFFVVHYATLILGGNLTAVTGVFSAGILGLNAAFFGVFLIAAPKNSPLLPALSYASEPLTLAAIRILEHLSGADFLPWMASPLLVALPTILVFRSRPIAAHVLEFSALAAFYIVDGLFFYRDAGLLLSTTIVPLVGAGLYIAITLVGARGAARTGPEGDEGSKRDFLTNVGHELRTPLNGVIGMAELLWTTRLDDEQREYVDVVKRSGESLLVLINDLLDYSKLESGRIKIVEKEYSIDSTVETVLDLLATAAAEKKLDLLYYPDPATPPTLLGDAERIKQILFNLVGNSVKFTEEGFVVVSTSLSHDRKKLLFSVEDSGIGISQEHFNTIFEKFTQIDSSDTRRYSGIGLGLAITRELIHLMDGEISVSSTPGKGTVFSFVVPFKASPGSSKARSAPPALQDKHVLYVDHVPMRSALYRTLLKDWGLSVLYMASIEEAAAVLKETAENGTAPCDLILSAFNAAKDSYWTSSSFGMRVRGDALLRQLPSILLFPPSARETGRESLARWFDVTVPLPVHLDSLQLAIVEALKAEKRVDSVDLPASAKQVLPILLAEDNPVNQKVQESQLVKAGYAVHLAHNGEQALRLYQRERYALVLMDNQMPVMDGLEATREIREFESKMGRPRTPIIALTGLSVDATALASARAAGADEIVQKPVVMSRLLSLMDSYMTEAVRKSVFNLEEALEIVGRDPDLLRTVLFTFLEDVERKEKDLDQAFSRNDSYLAYRISHSFRGAAASIGADRLVDSLNQLESDCLATDAAQALSRFRDLKNEIVALVRRIREYLAGD